MNKDVTEILPDSASGIARARLLLASGELVAFPTETVYGLGADARNGLAVAKIFEAKQRPSFNPLIVHVADLETAEELVALPSLLKTLAIKFWPGPLTIVAPLRPEAGISELVSSGLSTLAVRVPDHLLARALLKEFGAPIAAPSANPSGLVSPTTHGHVLEGLNGKIAAVFEGGNCPVGLESTIVTTSGEEIALLRPGGLNAETLRSSLGRPIISQEAKTISAPGQLASHYATAAPIRLNAEKPHADEAFLAFGSECEIENCLDLSPERNLTAAAANLFSHLRALDQMVRQKRLAGIAVASVPENDLGLAINDRLRRAAAPRTS